MRGLKREVLDISGGLDRTIPSHAIDISEVSTSDTLHLHGGGTYVIDIPDIMNPDYSDPLVDASRFQFNTRLVLKGAQRKLRNGTPGIVEIGDEGNKENGTPTRHFSAVVFPKGIKHGVSLVGRIPFPDERNFSEGWYSDAELEKVLAFSAAFLVIDKHLNQQ